MFSIAFAATLLTMLVAAPASAAPRAATFHGTFSEGMGWWSTLQVPEPVIDMPVTGGWNLNINLTGGRGGHANGVFVVRYIDGGLHALWTPSAVDLVPLTEESPLASFLPALTGVVNDPPNVYAYTAHLTFLDSTMVVVYDAAAETFFYAAQNGPGFMCPPPSDEVPFCWDRLQVLGTVGR
jgi:hypothetical protein